jgi:hypothetical protein
LTGTEAGTEARLAQLRGATLPRAHNARTIAALASNPGCARRAILDAAGIDKQRIAAHAGFPSPFGQSKFALARGNAFEAALKADGAARLLTLLREQLNLPVEQAHYKDIADVAGNDGLHLRHTRTRAELTRAAETGDGTMFDHPLLRLAVGGRYAYLEPDLTAFQIGEKFHILEIKSFAVIDGQADGEKVAAAAIQSAVYVLALTDLLGDSQAVHHETILVCPKDFSNHPVASRLDVRKQLTVLRRQLSRMASIDDLLDELPPGLTFDLDPDATGVPQRAAADVRHAVGQVSARYCPECPNTCEMCFFCRDEAADRTVRLGKAALEEVGGIDGIPRVLRLARGEITPAPGEEEAAGQLRAAARLRAEVFGAGAGIVRAGDLGRAV